MKPKENHQVAVNTSIGRIIAYVSNDPNYPGVYIDFEPKYGDGDLIPLCVVEHNENEKRLQCSVYGDVNKDEYTSKQVFNTEELNYSRFTVDETSDAFEDPYIIRDHKYSDDQCGKYYGTGTFETYEEAKSVADELNKKEQEKEKINNEKIPLF